MSDRAAAPAGSFAAGSRRGVRPDSETLPPGSIRRLRYDPGDGSRAVEGTRAPGRSLEHIHLGWALAGMVLRLPRVWQFLQLVTDGGGPGPWEPAGPILRPRPPLRLLDLP